MEALIALKSSHFRNNCESEISGLRAVFLNLDAGNQIP